MHRWSDHRRPPDHRAQDPQAVHGRGGPRVLRQRRQLTVTVTSGRPWVFLRGLSREAGHWGDFVERWRARFPYDAVVTPDLPGCGAEHATASPTSVAAIAAHVRAQVHATSDRHRDEPVWLLAMSLGAMVACHWMLAHPGEVAGVVLINGSVGALSPPWRRMRVAGLLRLVRAVLSRDLVARERLIASVVSGRPAAAEGVLARWVELARGRPVRLATALRQILAAARFRLPAAVGPAAAAAAPVPALVLVSSSDRLVHPSCSAAIARRLEAVVREHPDAGHDLPLDDPEWVADQVDDWLVAENRST